MKVFIDTNVWLAGRFGRGLCAEFLDELVMLDAAVMLDERVLAEFRRVGVEKFRVGVDALDEAVRFFHRYAKILPAAAEPVPGVADPDDAWIIAAAIAARADWFVTGDRGLLDLGLVQGMAVLSPRQAYTRLRGLD